MALNKKSYQPAQSVTVKALEDLPAFRFVSHLGSVCAEEYKSLGVTELDWAKDDFAAIVTLGTIAIETTTTINIGDSVTSDALGMAKPASGSMPVNGHALSAASGEDFVKITLVP
jgi:hypothetical protein